MVFILCVASSCKKEAPEGGGGENPTAEDISYKEVNLTFDPMQNTSVFLDVDLNGSNDFQFYTDRFETDIDQLEAFLVKPLGSNKVLVIKLTDNPLFDSKSLFSFNTPETITENTPLEHAWNTKNGALALKHHSTSDTFIGRWSDGTPKTMAFQLSSSGKSYYGWIKLQYSRENNAMSILSYAYNKTSGGPIKAGSLE